MKSLFLAWSNAFLAAFFLTLPNSGHAQTNTAASVTITQPTNASTFNVPTNIQFDVSVYGAEDVAYISFAATPAGGGVVEPIVIHLGVVTNWVSLDPSNRLYTFDWSNAVAGTWTINATAFRSDDSYVGSGTVHITVNPDAAPSVTITSPTDGAAYPWPTNINLIANVVVGTDTVSTVEFFDGSQPIGVASVVDMSPEGHTYLFDWTNPYSGSHVITAIAKDAKGNTFSSAPVTIMVGNPPPIVHITQPTDGSMFMAPIDVESNVSVTEATPDVAYVSFAATPAGDGGIVEPIEVLLGNATNWISLDPPNRIYIFDWSNAFVGTWLISATAYRNDDSYVGSDTVQITVKPNSSLSVTIGSPTNGAAFSGPTNIEIFAGVAATNDSAAFVTFFDGLEPIGVATNFAIIDPPGSTGLPPGGRAYAFDWTNQSAGVHVITAVATDTNDNTFSSAPVIITVGNAATNPPLIVRITSPPNTAVFRAPVNVALLAYAHDSIGRVVSVEFFAGTNDLGFGQPLRSPIVEPLSPGPIPTNPPVPYLETNIFELIWSNAPPATYAITALAMDSDGGSATSAPVNITILPAVTPRTNFPAVVRIVATDPIAIEGTNCWPWLGGPTTWSNWESPRAIWRSYTNCGPNDATFTVFRDGGITSNLTVYYAIGGTATNGVDYVALPGSVTIPSGQSEATITVIPIDTVRSNFSSTVVLSLERVTNSPADYIVGLPGNAEAIIIDSNGSRLLPLSGILPDRSFHLSLPGPDGAWFHIDYTTDLINWTPICTNQVINGSVDFIDPNASESVTRMYRTVPMAGPPSD